MINLRRKTRDLAVLDGRRRVGLDSIMTALSFVLLLVIVVTPISMIVYHAFFHQGQFSLDLIIDQFTRDTTVSAMWNTIKIAILVTIFGTIVGCFTPGCSDAATFQARS